MSNETTRRMIEAYKQSAAPTRFLSGFFQSPARNFHNSEEVEIDIVRGDEEIAIAIQNLSTGARANSTDIYTNKSFIPPIFSEKFAINSFDLLKRMAGDTPFEDPDFRASAIVRMFDSAVTVEAKIRRSMELQASQVLQTGVVTLIDSNGVAVYSIDYKPKATHLVTVGTAWDGVTPPITADISGIAEVIRNDGLADPDQLIMGINAYNAFVNDPAIKSQLDTRRIDTGGIQRSEVRGNGGTFRGQIDIGNYTYDIWTYGGRYNHPQTGVKTQFLDPAKVIVRASGGRLDATFGAVPNIGSLLGGGNNPLSELPSRVQNGEGGMDMFMNSWLTEDGTQLMGSVAARPLMIPTAIDTFGTLSTGT